MSLQALIPVIVQVGFPRASGDEPAGTPVPAGVIPFSPRERG